MPDDLKNTNWFNSPTKIQQLTTTPQGHILTNANVWSNDSNWLVYDVRSDPAGDQFDGTRIEKVNLNTKQVITLYESKNNAHCGVATFSPTDNRIVFIHGPEHPTPDWSYSPWHRRGVVIVSSSQPYTSYTIDARDLTPPYTPGALRGGTHVHMFSPDGQYISFTYEDHVLASAKGLNGADLNQRNVGISIPSNPVIVNKNHPRNHDGQMFSVLVTRTVNQPQPDTDQINRAYSNAWIGRNGYIRADGKRQHKAIAFLGDLLKTENQTFTEVFVVDIPDQINQPENTPLQGTPTQRPGVPKGTTQRRLTNTTFGKHKGIQGPRHWVNASNDGQWIGFYKRDDTGLTQFHIANVNTGRIQQISHHQHDIQSAFTWSPDDQYVTYIMDDCVCITRISDGQHIKLEATKNNQGKIRGEACVFSPDGLKIAYVKHHAGWNQIYVVSID